MPAMNETPIALIALASLLALLVGAAISWLVAQRRLQGLRDEKVRLEAELAAARQTMADKARDYEQASERVSRQLGETFKRLADETLGHHTDQFLKLAKQNLEKYQERASGELNQREQAIENLVKPIREALSRTEQQIQTIEKERRESFGSLTSELKKISDAHQNLHQETSKLVNALRRPEVRGQWGEMTLKRLAELAGMVEHCDFYEQQQVRTGEGAALRPDMVVRMPDGREIVVDAKTPLDAYLAAVEASDDASREEQLKRHTRKVRERVKELAAKSYWQQFKNSPDFVVLFIPGEQFLSAALDRDRSLLEDALAEKVILSTPTSFVALLRAVAYGWRQESLAENAEQIRSLGEELYGRLTTFGDYLGKLGKSLSSSVDHYNKAVGSFDSRVLPGARKFNELGIRAKKELEDGNQVEKMVRPLASDE